MSKERTLSFRATDDDNAMLEAIAKRMDMSKSDALRMMVNQFGIALGIAPGKARIKVTVERVGELEY